MKSFNIIFSILFLYIVAALTFWWFSLMKQSRIIAQADTELLETLYRLDKDEQRYRQELAVIEKERTSRKHQYLGEGLTFLIITMAGALVVYRSFIKTIELSQQQNNFMLAVTHELKSPVAGIKLGLETLNRHKLSEEQKKSILKSGVQEADRLTEMCDNILIASQIEGQQYKMVSETFCLSDALQDWCTLYKSLLQERLQLNILPHLYTTGDEGLLHIAFNNLLQNAIKYAEDGLITVRLRQQDQRLHLSVEDQGPGIPDEEKKKLFKKFYRIGSESTRKRKGTGLGLYLVKQIAKQHKGKVILRDHHPHGAIFEIILKNTAVA